MSNFVERFRQRETLPFEIDVPIDLGHDKFIFKIRRFAQEEINAARKDAQRDIRERGDDPKELEEKSPLDFVYYLALALCHYLERHIKGWEHIAGNGTPPLDYNEKVTADLFSEMNESERAAIGMSYLTQLQKLGAKKNTSEKSATKNKSEVSEKTSLNASD